jgi:hypothetical protein
MFTDFCEGYDCDKTKGKSEASIPLEFLGEERQGNENKEDVEPGAEENEPGRFNPSGLALSNDYFFDFLDKRPLMGMSVAIG